MWRREIGKKEKERERERKTREREGGKKKERRGREREYLKVFEVEEVLVFLWVFHEVHPLPYAPLLIRFHTLPIPSQLLFP